MVVVVFIFDLNGPINPLPISHCSSYHISLTFSHATSFPLCSPAWLTLAMSFYRIQLLIYSTHTLGTILSIWAAHLKLIFECTFSLKDISPDFNNCCRVNGNRRLSREGWNQPQQWILRLQKFRNVNDALINAHRISLISLELHH